MFGHDALNHLNINNLIHKAENITFRSTNYDVEPTDGSGKYTKVKWYANVSNYHYQADNGLGWTPTKFKTTKCVIEFLKASDKNNLNRIAKTTHGIKFLSLNPDEANTTEDCGLGTEYVDGINNPKDPSKIQDDTNDDSNGDMGTLTDTTGEVEPEESDNTILYGVIALAAVCAFFILR